MRSLFQFIIRNSSWLIAIFLIAISFYLVFTHNSYQRSIYLSSANSVTGWVFDVSSDINSFMHLKQNNQKLLEQNAYLERELTNLKSYVNDLKLDTMSTNAFLKDSMDTEAQFSFIPAEVTNVSFSGVNNFITVNKGLIHGVEADMGVVSHDGVVGVVLTASNRYSVIIPILNPKFRLSAKLKNSDNSGSISWNGKDLTVAQLGELPKHEVFEVGDTVVTSFSRIFPKDIVIGYVKGSTISSDDNFNNLNLNLATNFHSLMGVLIIKDKYFAEKNNLEESIR